MLPNTFGEGFLDKRKQVTFDCDESALKRLEEWAEIHGLTRDEALRFAVGQLVPDLRRFHTPLPESLSLEDTPAMKMLARVFTAQGAVKCPDCTTSLSSKALLEGKCQSCGKEL